MSNNRPSAEDLTYEFNSATNNGFNFIQNLKRSTRSNLSVKSQQDYFDKVQLRKAYTERKKNRPDWFQRLGGWKYEVLYPSELCIYDDIEQIPECELTDG